MLNKLLQAGAKVNAYCYYKRQYKWTALHFAVLNNNIGCVKLLVRNGADENIQGKRGEIVFVLSKMVDR